MRRFLREELALLALMGAATVQTGLAFDAMNGMVRSSHTVMSEAAPRTAMVMPPIASGPDALILAHEGARHLPYHPALQD